MGSANRNPRQLGCAVLLTAAVAFPAGMWLAGSDGAAPTPPATRTIPTSAAEVRNPYSATIRTDPYVLDRQRALVEQMESDCRNNGNFCPEARGARRYLDELGATE